MKVGKVVTTMPSPIGTIIYATNMVPVTVFRTGKSQEYDTAVKEATEKYEAERKKQAEQFGELD